MGRIVYGGGYSTDGTVRELVEMQAAWAARAMRRSTPKTLSLILGAGSVDVPVTWSTPMPSEVYEVTIADTLASGVSAVVRPGQTAAGCTVRVTATAGLALGTALDLTAWT